MARVNVTMSIHPRILRMFDAFCEENRCSRSRMVEQLMEGVLPVGDLTGKVSRKPVEEKEEGEICYCKKGWVERANSCPSGGEECFWSKMDDKTCPY
jgi:hypothetical protein